jgi:hypothetical protein
LTEKPLLERAKSLGFTAQLNEANIWQILPKTSQETWKLTEAESRWILSVRNIPQLILNLPEAITFLESHH